MSDLERAASSLAARLPEPLRPLAGLAYDMRWSWMPGADELFASIDRERWHRCRANPVRLLLEASGEAIEAAAEDDEFLARAGEIIAAVRADHARPVSSALDGTVAFFCAEYAVHRSLPIYSGGLGVLAGDVLKQASDDALPFVAIGLMYREGYFRQRIDATGWQQESWVDNDPERLPMALITGDDGEPLVVRIPVGKLDVAAQIWEVRVGRVRLLLLDTDHPANDGVSRWITARLYVGDPAIRLAQYLVLGIGGVRALEALAIEPAIVHLNEGHAAFAALELAAQSERRGAPVDEALAAAREITVFTTHTPVPAGNDTYDPAHVAQAVGRAADAMGLGVDRLLAMGRTNPDDGGEPFGVTQFALRTSRAANGVSARHGEVARSMWHGLWPDRSVEDVPIASVTNGVHVPTWVGGPIRHVLDRHLGAGWFARASDRAVWEALDDVSDEELWSARCRQRAALIAHVRDNSVRARLARGDTLDYARAANEFTADALTIGFARRVATYKRIGLLLAELEANLTLLGADPPVQLLIAGKAHPRDNEAKRLLQELFEVRGAEAVARRVAFLEDYDVETGARLVAGCDVWLNLPRPPLEASGTSGMKSVVNGGLHLSVLDGWWAEAYDGANGWALPGEVWEDAGAQDARDGAELHRLLAEEVRPLFCDRGADGIPHGWLAMVRASMKTLAPRFGAGRMLADYAERMYPVAAGSQR